MAHDVYLVDRLYRGFRIATMAPPGSWLGGPRSDGNTIHLDSSSYGIVENAVLATRQDRIAWILPESSLPKDLSRLETIQGNGEWLTPGLIDCHTHLVYGGNRAHEWEARLKGMSYAEIAKSGGGILSTVRSTREATEDELYQAASVRLKRLMSEGVTTIEIKSGYGLELETELKQLRVALRLGREFGVTVQPTLLAAHAVPKEFQGHTEDYVDWICQEMIPAAKGICTAVDVFCETIAFSLSQTQRIFQVAIDHGLRIKVHAEQLSASGSAAMAAKMGALSADHLEYLQESECAVLAEHGTVATLLPGAYYCLKEKQAPPIAALRNAGVPMAVATDCNPGSSPLQSLLLAANMACNMFGLTVQEAWLGMTRHAAQALGLEKQVGSLLPGLRADLAIWNAQSLSEILYGIGHNPCSAVYYGSQSRS